MAKELWAQLISLACSLGGKYCLSGGHSVGNMKGSVLVMSLSKCCKIGANINVPLRFFNAIVASVFHLNFLGEPLRREVIGDATVL